jgi:hypothetical protein
MLASTCSTHQAKGRDPQHTERSFASVQYRLPVRSVFHKFTGCKTERASRNHILHHRRHKMCEVRITLNGAVDAFSFAHRVIINVSLFN